MVAAKPIPQAVKRKKTADMPESPPKRVTRARAKATTDLGTKPKIAKITTVSAKVAAEKQQAIEPQKAVKRKTRADDEQDKPPQESMVEQQPKMKSAKASGKVKKVEPVEEDLKQAETLHKTRGRPPKIASTGEPKAEATKPRGRGRKAATPSISIPVDIEGPVQKEEPVKRSTRGRPASAAVDTSSVPKPAAAKKRVKFQDESDKDKENIPIQKKVGKATISATGLKARPVRKPATARATRGRKTGEQTTNIKGGTQDSDIHPLSPKKVKQVAKSSSMSSEDELCGEKTPMRNLSLSPIKPPVSSNRGMLRGVSQLDLKKNAEPVSPTKDFLTTVLASPAKRPPPSPFKDALKGSPKRGNLGDTMIRQTPKSMQSPVRVLFGESARRGNLGDALSRRPLLYSQSPTKVSLFQSPARRPAASPMKLAAPRTPGKSGPSIPNIDAVTASKHLDIFELPDLSLLEMKTGPLRAARSPGHSVKVHEVTTPDQKADLDHKNPAAKLTESLLQVDQVAKTVPSSIPVKDTKTYEELDIRTLESPSPGLAKVCDATSLGLDSADLTNSTERSGDDTGDALSTTPPGPPSILSAPVLNPVLYTLRHTPEDSDSEDELASPQKTYAPTPLRKFGVSTKDFSTPTLALAKAATRKSPFEGSLIEGDLNASLTSHKTTDNVSITPLALQLSSWLASSPEKKTPLHCLGQGRGTLSPLGATIFDRPDHEVIESPPKTSFFEDQMAMHDSTSDGSPCQNVNQAHCMDVHTSQDSQALEEYGDENAVPIDPLLLEVHEKVEDQTLTCTPARIFSEQPREIHTVSKVPLRPAGDDSPRKIPRKRSKSLAVPLAVIKTPERSITGRSRTAVSKPKATTQFEITEQGLFPTTNLLTPTKGAPEDPQTPKTGSFSIAGTPFRTNTIPDVLKGAVVYVDVHTSEGADASGIFVELLTQMGARCVKQWLWNPRASAAGTPADASGSSDTDTLGAKIGITHVVYKDGGKRTLEKVRESKGVVLCVGVGWVLE